MYVSSTVNSMMDHLTDDKLVLIKSLRGEPGCCLARLPVPSHSHLLQLGLFAHLFKLKLKLSLTLIIQVRWSSSTN